MAYTPKSHGLRHKAMLHIEAYVAKPGAKRTLKQRRALEKYFNRFNLLIAI
jgi:hypothetical protein